MTDLSELKVLPYDITSQDRILNDDGEERFRINIWSLDRDSKPCLVRVEDFPNFVWVELPSFVNGSPFVWDGLQASKVFSYICKVMDDKKPISHEFQYKQKLYYYQGDRKYPMILLKFNTLESMTYCKNLLSKPRNIYGLGSLVFNVYEAHIDPVCKFMTAIDASFCSWLSVKGEIIPFDSDKRISTKGTVEKPITEILVSFRDISMVNGKECESWFVSPRIVSFDIETYTNNHKAMPNSLNSLHVCNIISCIYYEIGKPESKKKYVFVLGDSEPVEGSTVVCVNTELELINNFAHLIIELDPEIISGYNIFAYDYPYLENRLKTKLEDWPQMSRMLNHPTEMSTMKWKSGAYGYQVINILQMSGRLSIDLLPIIKRDYKLDMYNLDFVSKYFIGSEKHDVKPVDMFIAYEHQKFVYDKMKEYLLEKTGKSYNFKEVEQELLKYINDPQAEKLHKRYIIARNEITRIVAYCVQDSNLVVDLFDKLNVWIGLNALSSVVGVTIMQLFTRGQQIRCLSQVFNKCFKKGIVLDRRIKDKVFYNGGLVQHPIVGLHTGVVCLDFASLYPSIMRAYNICFTTLVPPELFDSIEDEKIATVEVEQEEPADGKAIKGSADEDNDFFNDNEIEEPEDDKEIKTVMKTYKYKWVNKATRYGVLPEIQDHLVGSRNIIKKEIAELEDELEDCSDPKRLAEIKMLLVLKDKYSNALKVSANSLYGFLGAQEGGVLSLIEAAMCITCTGRKLICEVNNYVEEKYKATIVYGDTDSSMIDLHIPSMKEAYAAGLRIADEISGTPEKKLPDGTIIPAKQGLFPPPLKIEFEKLMKMLSIKKKKYAALLFDKNGEYVREKNKDGSLGELKILKRGIIVARRDTAKIVHKTYNKMLSMILTDQPMYQGYNLLLQTIEDLVYDRIPVRGNLSIIRSLGDNYKSDSYFMKVFGDELVRVGKPANPSDRLEYVVVKTEAEENDMKLKMLQGLKMRLVDMYEDSWNIKKDIDNEKETIDYTDLILSENDPKGKKEESIAVYPQEKIDYEYYISDLMCNPLDQLFSIGYAKELEKFKELGYSPQFCRRKAESIVNPIKMLSLMFNDYKNKGYKVDDLKQYVTYFKDYYTEMFKSSYESADIIDINENKENES